MVPVWPFKPDWTNPVLESYEWLTTVLASRTGAEQRQALRQFPRRRIDYPVQLHGQERAYFDVFLSKSQGTQWWVPVPSETIRVDYLPAIGDTSLPVPLAEPVNQFRIGGSAVIMDNVFNAELVEVTSISSHAIGISALTKNYGRGTILAPAMLGTITEAANMSRKAGGTYEGTARFEADEVVTRISSIAPLLTYKGYPVLTRTPNSISDLEYSYERPLLTIDNSQAIPNRRDVRGFSTTGQRYEFTMFDTGDKHWFLDLCYALKGQAGAVWVPTFNDDLAPGQGWPDPDDVLNQVPQRDTAIEFHRDGSYVIRNAQQGVQGTEDVPLFSGVGPIAMTSFMTLKRLGVDTIEFNHYTNRVATAAVIFKDAPDLRQPGGYYKNPFPASDPTASAQPALDMVAPITVGGGPGGQP